MQKELDPCSSHYSSCLWKWRRKLTSMDNSVSSPRSCHLLAFELSRLIHSPGRWAELFAWLLCQLPQTRQHQARPWFACDSADIITLTPPFSQPPPFITLSPTPVFHTCLVVSLMGPDIAEYLSASSFSDPIIAPYFS